MAKSAPATKTLPSPSSDQSIRIEKISNGFIVSQDSWDGKGNYTSKKTFSPNQPEVELNPDPKAEAAEKKVLRQEKQEKQQPKNSLSKAKAVWRQK